MKTITRRAFASGIALLPALRFLPASAQAQISVTPAEARDIAREAYIYGEPIVDNYRIQHAYWVDRKNPEYKGPWNQIWNSARLFTPADTAIQTANTDTLYSFIGADLRAEPLVLTVPAMEKERYFSVQFIDYYTFNFDYAGTRTTGNGGGTFLLAGPNWKGETPKGIDKVFRSETELVFPRLGRQRLDEINGRCSLGCGLAEKCGQRLNLVARLDLLHVVDVTWIEENTLPSPPGRRPATGA